MEHFDEIHVVSDLHIGGVPGRQIFDQGPLLAATIDHLRERPASRRVALVLDGDIVDFLAAEDAAWFDPEGAVKKLEATFGDPAFAPVWAALGRFVRAEGRVLVLALGNHDVELALPEVQDRLLDEICGGDAAARGRVRISMDGTGFACIVGGRRVLCVHGNEVDAWNVVPPDAVRAQIRAQKQGLRAPAWEANAGTRLVVDIMNAVKARYPLVDLFKPEALPLMAIILALDPSQLAAIRRLAPVVARLGTDHTRLALLGGMERSLAPQLSEDEALEAILRETGVVAPPARAAAGDWLNDAERAFAAGSDALEVLPGGAAERTLGVGAIFLDRLRRREPITNLREALAGWLRSDKTFEIDTDDETSRALDEAVSDQIDYLVAGHTHLARALPRRRGDGFYFNSGTWIRLIRVTDAMTRSDDEFAPVFKAFAAGTLDALDAAVGLVLRVPTVVSIEAGARSVVAQLNNAEIANGSVRLNLVPGSRFESPRRDAT